MRSLPPNQKSALCKPLKLGDDYAVHQHQRCILKFKGCVAAKGSRRTSRPFGLFGSVKSCVERMPGGCTYVTCQKKEKKASFRITRDPTINQSPERPIPSPIPTCPHMISHTCTLADLQVCPKAKYDEVTTSMPILQPAQGITSTSVDQYTRKANGKLIHRSIHSNSHYLHISMLSRCMEHIIRRCSTPLSVNIIFFQQASQNCYQPIERKRRRTKKPLRDLLGAMH